MPVFDETLDRISRSGEAVFALDGANRIILWNRACETLLGVSAREVLGKPCHDVTGGRDGNGNLYCHANCPVAYQAREKTEEPVRPFEFAVRTGDGALKRVSTSLFAIPSYHPALTTVVHVLRDAPPGAPRPTALPEPLEPLAAADGQAAALTPRETEILRRLSKGEATGAIATDLGIARATVRNHVQSLLQKLGVHSKLEAVVAAQRSRLLEPKRLSAAAGS